MQFQIICAAVFCVLYVFSFQQNDYKFIFERASLEWYNSSYVKNFKLKIFHHTRYEKWINISYVLLQDLKYDIENAVQCCKFQSNEYRLFPFYYEDNACNTLKLDIFGFSPTHYNSNLIACPMKKGFYYVNNIYVDDSKFPPFAPRGRFMCSVNVTHKKTILLGWAKMYFEITPTNPLERVIHPYK